MKTLKNMLFAFVFGALAISAVYADINKDLVDSAKYRYVVRVQSLIKQGANVNAKDENGWSALMFASTQGDLELVKFLVENGADINVRNKNGFTAITEATRNKYLEVVQYLKSKGAKE